MYIQYFSEDERLHRLGISNNVFGDGKGIERMFISLFFLQLSVSCEYLVCKCLERCAEMWNDVIGFCNIL